MMLSVNASEDQNVAEQKARAVLREGFLRAVTELMGKPCSMLTYEQSTLKATFTALNPSGSDILTSNLETPAGIKIPSALLRTPDIIAIHFENTSQ